MLVKQQRTATRKPTPAALYATAVRTRSSSALDLLAAGASGTDSQQLLSWARNGKLPADIEVSAEHLYAFAAAAFQVLGAKAGAACFTLATMHSAAVPAKFQLDYARCLLQLGQDPLSGCDALTEIERLLLKADAAHPKRGGDEQVWLQHLRLIVGVPELRIGMDHGSSRFDNITLPLPHPTDADRLFSIIMTCHEPGQELLTAVRSVVAQSWQDWELLLIDDGSGADYADVLAQAAALDPRVRVTRLADNVGTYRARNIALAQAQGDLVTGLDSDDLALPSWLYQQAVPLVQDSSLVMSVAEGIRATPELTFANTGRAPTMVTNTSIMFRRAPVLERVGYYDPVRKGGDVEYERRITVAFGNQTVARLRGTYVCLVRIRRTSLSAPEVGDGWLHPARLAYYSAAAYWYRSIAAGQADPYLSGDLAERKFAAPTSVRDGVAPTRLDTVAVADCRYFDVPQQTALDQLKAAHQRGLRTGMMHVESLARPSRFDRLLHAQIVEQIDALGAEVIAADDPVAVATLVVSDPELWRNRERDVRLSRVGSVVVS